MRMHVPRATWARVPSIVALELRGRQGAILAIRPPVVFLVNENIRPENVECSTIVSVAHSAVL